MSDQNQEPTTTDPEAQAMAWQAQQSAPDSLPELPDDEPMNNVYESVEDDQPVYQSRIEKLTAVIAKNPITAANYVYRGEAYLDEGDFFHAEADFRQAVTLATAQAQTSNWGYIYSALIDRAHEGLRRLGL
jgi:tetratricopeptide (TPR) repeat protein